MIQGNIIANFVSLTIYHSHAVIDEKISADSRPGMNLNADEKTSQVGNGSANKKQPSFPEPVGKSVQSDCMQPGVAE